MDVRWAELIGQINNLNPAAKNINEQILIYLLSHKNKQSVLKPLHSWSGFFFAFSLILKPFIQLNT